jgi:hypothetical protein
MYENGKIEDGKREAAIFFFGDMYGRTWNKEIVENGHRPISVIGKTEKIDNEKGR